MSHFSKIEVKFKDQACLVEALQRFGFYPQIHDQPVHLYGYRGDTREQTAHIVVPRNQISFSSNDQKQVAGCKSQVASVKKSSATYKQPRQNCFALVFISSLHIRYGVLLATCDLLLATWIEYINLYLPKLALQMGGEVVETVTTGSVTTVRVSLPTVTVRR